MNESIGKMLILMGIIIIIVGIIFVALPKLPSLPKLPGDILIKNDNFTFYFPWVTSLVISAVLSLLFYLFFRK
ncbi:MAG: DUF2905 domain-containing protein [Candidatus Levybacteria bacterium]|nr:DUF2905 domain-containing protein [Candidatus Levybacteria bacterium]